MVKGATIDCKMVKKGNEMQMRISFFRGDREYFHISYLEEVRAELKKMKTAYRIFFRGPRVGSSQSTLKKDAKGFVVYYY